MADVLSALDELGIDVERVSGNEAYMLCPYHDDHKIGSFKVNIVTGDNVCFACGGGGSLVTLVKEVLGIPRSVAIRRLIAVGGTAMDPGELRDRIDSRRAPRVQRVVEEVSLPAAFAQFSEPPDVELRKRRISRSAAEKYGLRWDDKGGAWVMPIRTLPGDLVGWQLKRGTYVRNLPPGVSKGLTLFGSDHFPAQRSRAIILESPLDAPRLHSAGVAGGLATYGAGMSATQLRMLLAIADEVVLAYDNDAAGRTATRLARDGNDGTRNGRVLESGGLMGRIPLKVLNYDVLGRFVKDPGDMEDEECVLAVEHAIPATLARL